MTKIIDTSFQDRTVTVSASSKKIVIVALKGFWSVKRYTTAHVVDVTAIGEDTFRNGGKALAGAVIGGVLTGGVGFLAGAAFGGRRRREGMYVIRLNDGHHVAVETANKKIIAALQPFLIRKTLEKLPSQHE